MTHSAIVILKKGEDRRIRTGHPWVFSNEVETNEGAPQHGDVVEVHDSRRSVVGYGFFSKTSLVSVRMISNKSSNATLQELLKERIIAAAAKRTMLNYGDTCRLVFGESDNIPGLVIDRYGKTFVIESYIAGIDLLIQNIQDIIVELFDAEFIVEKSESTWRSYEGLEGRTRVLLGEGEVRTIEISSIFYNINILRGNKTGFFLDQRENRLLVEGLSRNRRVLDCFTSDGGFALHAARGGATSVTGVDSSDPAVERATSNAIRNGLTNVKFAKSDVFDYLHEAKQGEYDLIILDPPAFVKSKKKLASGLKGYRKLNELAMDKLEHGGILVTCSCSQHATEELFLDAIAKAAASKGKRLSIFSITGAAKDHPVLLSMPETRYLTCVAAVVEAL
ncbi:MAG: class I SAM-dependent rRNA methyltransferase [Ignavibacteria bacterium]|nr:class I SAM-dependent rRNA methyltransferase [Ignavibacteria bacterium]